MSRSFTPKVVTANALLDGDAVWFTAAKTWSGNIADAHVLTDAVQAESCLLAAQAQQDKIAGAYLADVATDTVPPTPTHFRETFRTRGPSNYFHGKQAS